MLKKDITGRWVEEPWLFRLRYRFVTGQDRSQVESEPFSKSEYQEVRARQETIPVPVMQVSSNRRCFWMFEGEFWWEDERLSADEIKALILARQVRRQRQIQTAMALVTDEADPATKSRTRIPDDVRLAVWTRDGGRCVKCRATQDLEFDHIIPVSRGGSSTERNVQILCQRCNLQKSDSIA